MPPVYNWNDYYNSSSKTWSGIYALTTPDGSLSSADAYYERDVIALSWDGHSVLEYHLLPVRTVSNKGSPFSALFASRNWYFVKWNEKQSQVDAWCADWFFTIIDTNIIAIIPA